MVGAGMRRMMAVLWHRRQKRGRGAALIEFAVVAPLLLAIVFGIIEYGYVFMVRQTMLNAAREGCRLASMKTSESPFTQAFNRINAVMDTTGLQGYSSTIVDADAGNNWSVTVSIAIPRNQVSLVGNFFGAKTGNLVADCSMRKEGVGAQQ